MTQSLSVLASGTTTTPPLSDAGDAQLLTAAVVGILVVVVLIVWAKFHPFLALMLGTATLGAIAAVAPLDVVTSFITGVGATFGSVGVLVALGAMLGKLLADSGGADVIVDTIIGKVGDRMLPWAMALIAAIIGLPMFFEIGVVILVPIIVLVASRTRNPLMRVGIPGLAGLSILHGLVPPHPGPVAAIGFLHAKLGYTLILGLIVAVPTLIISGPLLAMVITRLVPITVNDDHPLLVAVGMGRRGDQDSPSARTAGSTAAEAGGAAAASPAGTAATRGGPGAPAASTTGYGGDDDSGQTSATLAAPAADGGASQRRRPGFVVSLISIVLAVVLMLVGAIGELTLDDKNSVRKVTDFFGQPVVALLAAVLVAMVALGHASGMNREQVNASLGAGLPGVAGILLIVAAGGGFKQVLSDSGVAAVIANQAKDSHISVLVLGWLVAVAIRLATGSATVAITTAAGIVAPLGATLDDWHLALLVLAVGCGSLFFSHVNDAGFWLVKEYFGLTVWQTIKSWSLMETVVSVTGFACVMILNPIV